MLFQKLKHNIHQWTEEEEEKKKRGREEGREEEREEREEREEEREEGREEHHGKFWRAMELRNRAAEHLLWSSLQLSWAGSSYQHCSGAGELGTVQSGARAGELRIAQAGAPPQSPLSHPTLFLLGFLNTNGLLSSTSTQQQQPSNFVLRLPRCTFSSSIARNSTCSILVARVLQRIVSSSMTK